MNTETSLINQQVMSPALLTSNWRILPTPKFFPIK